MIQSHLFKCVAKQVWSQGILMRATTKNCCSYDASRASRHSESVSDFGSPLVARGVEVFQKAWLVIPTRRREAIRPAGKG